MKKRFLQRKNTRMYHVWLRSFMVCLCLALAGVSAWGQDTENWINKANTGWYNESGTEFTITTAEELAGLAQLVNAGNDFEGKTIILGSGFDFQGKTSWIPIGNSSKNVFAGTFDGKGNTISNFNVTHNLTNEMSDPYHFGLFGNVAKKAIIKNLNLAGNIKINLNLEENHNYSGFGGIAGKLSEDGSSIDKCTYAGTITVITDRNIPYGVGGICGLAINPVNITNCSNSAEIKLKVENCDNRSGWDLDAKGYGGIVGNIGIGTKVENCFNNGRIIIEVNNNNNMPYFAIGGIVGGNMNGGGINNCYNKGLIQVFGTNNTLTYTFVGGVSGTGESSNCYNIGDINVSATGILDGDASWYNSGTFVGGISGQYSSEEQLLKNCYNHGKITTDGDVIKGNIYTYYTNVIQSKVSQCYYLPQEGWDDIIFDKSDENVVGINENDFKAGKVAWLLRQLNEEDRSYVFGQNLNGNTPDEYPKLQCFDETLPVVYQLTLHKDAATTEIVYRNSVNLDLPDVGDNFGWFDSDGKEYFNNSEITNDLELAAFDKSQLFTIQTEVQNGTILITPSQEKYPEKAKIEFTLQENDGFQYEEGSLKCVKDEDNTEIEITNNNGTYFFTMPAANVTITATFEPIPPTMYKINIAPTENGTVTSDKAQAAADETITLTVTPADGYELSELYYMIGTGKTSITGTTFAMPESDVTVYATFKEKEDPTDPEEPVDPPVVDPTNYYNIYNETTYDFIDVSFSRNVVREGGSVNVYLGIPEGLDPAAVTLMFKRSLYGGWENLNTDDDGNYLINNIWTDIYVKAVVDESYIDPNPDENHIYIDLSETNDSIWLYTDHKLVEEGKTAVIQAEVAKSCQNKEIRYMYKRTVLGEWKEMPKDYSINQYVVRDITTDIYVKAYFVFDKQDPTTAKNPHHVYADITATCEGLYLDATRHKVADEGDTKVFLYVKKGFETKDARYLFKRGLKGEWEDLVPGIEQNTFQVTDIEGDIYLKGIDAIYTGTEDIDGMVRVYTKDGSLFVYTAQPEEISVVSMTGVTVKRTRQTGLQSYPLNQGIYVICVGEQVFKVRVK